MQAYHLEDCTTNNRHKKEDNNGIIQKLCPVTAYSFSMYF